MSNIISYSTKVTIQSQWTALYASWNDASRLCEGVKRLTQSIKKIKLCCN